MQRQISTLFKYDYWANTRILSSLSQLPASDESALCIIAHILLAQEVWFSRLIGGSAPSVWEKLTLDQCAVKVSGIFSAFSPYIEKLNNEEVNKTVNYKNTKGEAFSNTVEEILTHLFNHGTYHRGQIVERMKGKLQTMPVTDLIVFLRGK